MQEQRKITTKTQSKEVVRLKNFFRKNNTIISMLDGIVERPLAEKILHFSVGIETEKKLIYYSVKKQRWKEKELQDIHTPGEKYAKIEQYLSEIAAGENHFTKCCKCIGHVKKESTDISPEVQYLSIYYYMAVKIDTIESTFFHCVEQAYYDWIVDRLSSVMKAVSDSKSGASEDEIREFQRKIPFIFHNYMREVFDIDIENIITLSGINYERESCYSNLVFLLENSNQKNAVGVTLQQSIDIERKNIKKIRKLLQMGKEGQCLLVCRCRDKWKIKGLYEKNDLEKGGITFRFRDHMVWDMEIRGKYTVRYKYGKYVVEGKQFELDKLGEKYKEVFGRENNLERIFEEAIDQKHGTILIIIKRDGSSDIKSEIKRLVDESTGIQTVTQALPSKFIDSITTIDGALFVDESGICYGFGMILDSTAGLKGVPERGARFNSTRKYVRMCQEHGIKAMGVVISEDGMIDVFTTNDDFE